MQAITVTVDLFGETFTAELEGETVNLTVNGTWAGTATWRDGFINDGPFLRDDDHESVDVYAELDEALVDAIDKVVTERDFNDANEIVERLTFRLPGVEYHVSTGISGDVIVNFLILKGSEADEATDPEATFEEIDEGLTSAMEEAGFHFTGHAGGEGRCSIAGVEYSGGEYMHFAR